MYVWMYECTCTCIVATIMYMYMSYVCKCSFHMLLCMQKGCVTEREKYNLHEMVTSFQAIHQAEQHLEEVTKERSLYKTAIDTAKQSIWQFSSDGVFSPPQPACKSQPSSRLITAHYSFNMAQQVFYLNDPQQPGPMYFLTPRKCAIFGVCCEAIPHQVNYLIDKSIDTGKGANTIISMLHHFFEVHGLGEQDVHLHADNCGGQNKNNTMVGYLLWRVLTGLHQNITLSFMITGHTKFSPDWCFGLMKKR